MRLTVIPDDKTIGIDNHSFLNINDDWSWIPPNVHAFQWYDTWGEIEYKGVALNERVETLGIFENAVSMYQREFQRVENEKIAAEAARDYWEELREYRFYRLRETDWTQVADVPISESKKQEYQIYRQQLRDLISNVSDPKVLVLDPDHPDWPIKPT